MTVDLMNTVSYSRRRTPPLEKGSYAGNQDSPPEFPQGTREFPVMLYQSFWKVRDHMTFDLHTRHDTMATRSEQQQMAGSLDGMEHYGESGMHTLWK